MKNKKNNENIIFKKYNPLIANSLIEKRKMLSKDIIAILLYLIVKNNIKLKIEKKQNESNKESLTFYISRVIEKENELDEIERIIYLWIFNDNDRVQLDKVLKELPKMKGTNKRLKQINRLINNERKINKQNVEDLLQIKKLKDQILNYDLKNNWDYDSLKMYLIYSICFGNAEKITNLIINKNEKDDFYFLIKESVINMYIYSNYIDFYSYKKLKRKYVKAFLKDVRKN